MLSTMHKADTVTVRTRNQKMGGIDKNDAIIGNYSCIRKSYK